MTHIMSSYYYYYYTTTTPSTVSFLNFFFIIIVSRLQHYIINTTRRRLVKPMIPVLIVVTIIPLFRFLFEVRPIYVVLLSYTNNGWYRPTLNNKRSNDWSWWNGQSMQCSRKRIGRNQRLYKINFMYDSSGKEVRERGTHPTSSLLLKQPPACISISMSCWDNINTTQQQINKKIKISFLLLSSVVCHQKKEEVVNFITVFIIEE